GKNPSSEWRFHQDIYKNKWEAKAIVHAHSPHATAVSTHGKSIPVAMDDETVFLRLAQSLFAHNVEFDRPIRLIGFRLGNLEMPETRQSTFDIDE
ncbi:MAG: class II aldolase/adducin family protein, partial [Candidatus Poseidoniaceae archaeon]